MTFTEKQHNAIESLAAANYTIKQVAMYLLIPVDTLRKEYYKPDSEFRFHYDRGQLIAQTQIDMSTLESAKKGNITAQQRYDKRAKENKLNEAKERLFRSA